MALVTVSDTTLTDIADAIRAKNGTEDTYKPSEMPDAIEAISGGGITPTGTISITENGTHDVTNYASANVAVPVNVSGGGGTDYLADICDGSITRFDDENIVDMSIALFRGYNKSNVTVFLPNCKTLSGGYCFGGSGIKTVVLPALEKVTSVAYFVSGSGTTVLDIGTGFSTETAGIRNNAFNGGSSMNVLILRKTSAIVPLGNINAFTNTPFASGKAGGTLYVPNDLISSYQSASNWSTILGYATNSIQKIEGSAYENAYADGTLIPSNS